MRETTDQLLSKMADAIVKEVNPEAVVLFGSYARGNVGPDSDIDLIVIEEEPFGPSRSRWKETSRIRRSLSSFRVAKDILVFSHQEVLEWKDSPNHVLARALREGKQLYARP